MALTAALAGRPLDGQSNGEDRSRRRLVEQHVFREIEAGRLRPGDRVPEVEIARTLGMSLSPVREALFHLAHEGLIVHRPHRGFRLVELGAERVEEVYTFRAMLEGLAAARAATRITPEQVIELKRLIQEGEAALREGDVATNVERNGQFHTLIVRAADHSLLDRAWRMLAPLQWLLSPVTRPPEAPRDADDWVARHQKVLSAIRSGYEDLAERAAREHVLDAAAWPSAREASAAARALLER
jgi:DNA-binding GntR family transcriptional regulator